MQIFQYLARFHDSFFFLTFVGLLLLLVTHLVCLRFFKSFPASPLSGSVIMAFALYVAECLPQYRPNAWLLTLLMLQVVVLWIYSSFSLLYDFFLKESEGRQSDRFGLSAWIVCTTLVAIMINRISPLQHGVILLLGIFAIALWIRYAAMVSYALFGHIKNKFNEYVGAPLLLGAAATVCIAWMLHFIFQQRIPVIVYQFFVALACLLYMFIFAMWLGHYCRGKLNHLLASWNAENSLVFGVAAVIGLVSLSIDAPDWLVDALWFWSVVWCLIVTVIEVGHFAVQLAIRGVCKKVFIYDVKQWLRIFSYSMLYVFSWYYYTEHYSDNIVALIIAEHGLNFVSAIFILQIIYTCLADRLTPHDASSRAE